MPRPSLLFLGDSLVDFGNWPRRLPHYRVMSSGIPGEQAEELLWRLPVRTSSSPDIIIVMIGTNNLLLGDSDFPITIEQIAGELRRHYPPSVIIITSLLPFRIMGVPQMVRTLNLELEAIAARTDAHYFDLFSAFDRSGSDLFEADGVHLSEAGYQLWSDELLIFLASSLAKEPD